MNGEIKHKVGQFAKRLSGFATPIVGLSWEPSEADATKARRILSFLEDRRVLYKPDYLEIPRHCVESILEIRRFLTTEIGQLGQTSPLSERLRTMRAACRKFLERVDSDDRDIVDNASHSGHYASWIFYPALGELRAVFGVQIAFIANDFGLAIEPELASILPVEDLDEK